MSWRRDESGYSVTELPVFFTCEPEVDLLLLPEIDRRVQAVLDRGIERGMPREQIIRGIEAIPGVQFVEVEPCP